MGKTTMFSLATFFICISIVNIALGLDNIFVNSGKDWFGWFELIIGLLCIITWIDRLED